MRSSVSGSVLLGSLFVASASHAQSGSEEATRRLLIEQAQRRDAASDHDGALDLAERAGQLRMSASLRMFIAQQQAALGRLAPAFANADACTREAQSDPSTPDRSNQIRRCTTLAAELRPRLGSVTVRVPSPAPEGLRVTVGGEELNAAIYGVPYVVTPGSIVIEASSRDGRVFRREVSVAAGGDTTVDLALTPAAATATTSTEPTPTTVPLGATAPPVVAPVSQPAPRAARSSGVGPGPFVLAGAGVLAFGAAGIFYALRENAISGCTRVPIDDSLLCDATDTHHPQDAAGFNTATNVSLIVGTAALVGGVAWFVLGGGLRRTEAPPRARLGIAPLARGAALTLGGTL